MQEGHPEVATHIHAEAQAKEQVADLTRRVKKYESVFGSSQPSDVQELSVLLQKKEDEISRFRLLEKQREQVGQICVIVNVSI